MTLPESPPITTFPALLKNMSECAVACVPELVHPGSGPFSLLDRYECTRDPAKRLDVVAVDAQSAEADKRGVSPTENARRDALKILRRAIKDGVDLRDVALYHLVTVARESVPLSTSMAAAELQKLGLERHDAAVIAVVLAEQSSGSNAVGLNKVRSLLASGQLNEARQAALSLPTDFPQRQEAIGEVDAARERLDALLAEARSAVQVPDEVRAAALLREAAAISAEDAEVALAAVPQAPPAGLRAVCEASTVKLFWQPAPGHDDGTTYVVTRTEQRPPAAAGDGSAVHRGQGNACTDTHAPVARVGHYGVFALADGRAPSRPAVTAVTLLPPVSHLEANVGPSQVTIHWSAHPAAEEVRVIRSGRGIPPARVAVTGNSCQLTGLPEGQAQHFEVTAIYRGLDGGEMRSAVAQINATPMSEAQPIPRAAGQRDRDCRGRRCPRGLGAGRQLRSAHPALGRAATLAVRDLGVAEEMTQFGQEVTGRVTAGAARSPSRPSCLPGCIISCRSRSAEPASWWAAPRRSRSPIRCGTSPSRRSPPTRRCPGSGRPPPSSPR